MGAALALCQGGFVFVKISDLCRITVPDKAPL